MKQTYNPDFYVRLKEIEENNFWFHNRNELIVWALQKYFPHAKNFFEIGCGTGFVLQGIQNRYPQLELHGSEILGAGLEAAAGRLQGVHLFEMDAKNIPYQNTFDVIGAFDVIEHVEEDEKVLSECFKAVRPQGGLLLAVPQHRFLWSYFDEHSHHVRRYERSELITKVEQAGFKVILTTSFVSLLLPGLMLARRKKRPITNDLEILDDLKVGPLTNSLLKTTFAVERSLIRAGFSFPAGSSLLLAAIKN